MPGNQSALKQRHWFHGIVFAYNSKLMVNGELNGEK